MPLKYTQKKIRRKKRKTIRKKGGGLSSSLASVAKTAINQAKPFAHQVAKETKKELLKEGRKIFSDVANNTMQRTTNAALNKINQFGNQNMNYESMSCDGLKQLALQQLEQVNMALEKYRELYNAYKQRCDGL